MAVSIVVTVSHYLGNGSTVTPYPTGFAFQENSWVNVYVTDAAGITTKLVLGTDYSVTGARMAAGGQVLTSQPIPATSRVTISRVSPKTQLLDLEYNDQLPSPLVEDALDLLTYITQELANERAISFPPTEPPSYDNELPSALARRSCVLGFDSITGEASLFQLPVPTVPVSPPSAGTFILGSVNGVLQWVPTVNCP
jgi:hypothetical protein